MNSDDQGSDNDVREQNPSDVSREPQLRVHNAKNSHDACSIIYFKTQTLKQHG